MILLLMKILKMMIKRMMGRLRGILIRIPLMILIKIKLAILIQMEKMKIKETRQRMGKVLDLQDRLVVAII